MATIQTAISRSEMPFEFNQVPEFSPLHWYAVYTYSRHEKRVADFLHGSQVDCFLPVYKSVRRWKDRQKQLDLPLFPSYVFVHIPIQHRLRVLTAPGVVEIVSVNGKPVPLPEFEIDRLRSGGGSAKNFEPHPYLKTGRRVRVRYGAMAGMEGILVRRKEKLRLVLSVELIQRSVALEVDEADVEPVN